MPQQDDESVNTAVVLTRRQHDALRAAAAEEDRSMSYYVRKALDRWFGFEKVAIDPHASEKESAA